MAKEFILGIDQGSTGSKAIVVNRQGDVVATAYRKLVSYYPQEGWLEHDPKEMWESVRESLIELSQKFDFKDILSIGITNQRETTLFWERSSGEPLTPAISWQCTRSGEIVHRWEPLAEEILEKTGLMNSTYYSASKIVWLLEKDPKLLERAKRGEICFGTVNSWILWQLTAGASHLTDSTNAGRTMFFDVQNNCWDHSLMEKMGIPKAILPKVIPCDGNFGLAVAPGEAFIEPIPVTASIGDQMSALMGQACFNRGEAKCTIGTCLNLVTFTGEYQPPQAGILPAIALNRGGCMTYELEGGVYVAGSVNEWLIEQLGIAQSPQEIDRLAQSVPSSDGVYLVPAFQGLGAPHWNSDARALIIGLSRYHDRRHICRAALESIALQAADVIAVLEERFSLKLTVLKVDGGVAKSDFMLKLLSNITGCRVERPQNTDRTPMGAVYLAGLSAGLWKDTEALRSLWRLDRAYLPRLKEDERERLFRGWKEAVKRSLDWMSAVK